MDTEHLIAQQNVLLQQIVDVLKQQSTAPLQPHRKYTLGFGESPRPKYIYCNRSQGGLWYSLADDASRTPQPIAHPALTCLVDRLEFKQVERRGRETWKTHLHVKADRLYILEAGYDSNFSRSLISALSVMTALQLQQPITIEVQAADTEEVLFCRVYSNGELIFAPWDEQTDWRKVARRAIANVDGAMGRNRSAA
ncbi:hypothetical protein C7B61_11090 [filamentous cyanobacterium CCP1]|nr:hypothetical protein C7B76_24780 [filamentous cyanobacterium CCP2]PSB65636.1 hypothetical protein C7B61_11090 [filamentous cyanobacterium CCP1]